MTLDSVFFGNILLNLMELHIVAFKGDHKSISVLIYGIISRDSYYLFKII